MKHNYFLISLSILIFFANTLFAATYYSKATGNANLTATWGLNVDGSGTAPANFTTAGDIFNLRVGSTLTTNNSWTIGANVTLNIIGSLDISTLNDHVIINGTLNLDGSLTVSGKNADITINGTVKFTNATATQVTLTGGGGGSGTDFILNAGASLITNNVNGVSGTNCSLPATAPKMAVTLNTAANYTFNGTAAQATLGLPATVNNLTINNTSATGVTLTAASVTVNGILTLTDGLLIGGTVNISITAPASVTAYSNASYCTGTLNRNINPSATYDFPVGTLTNYELATITTNAITGTTAIATYFSAVDPGTPLPAVTIAGTPIVDFLNYGRWVITPNIAIASGNFNLTLTETGHTNAAAFLDYHGILRSSATTPFWFQPGTHVVPAHTALTPTSPVTVSATGITSFPSNNFAIGFNSTFILPIELESFSAQNTGYSNLITWTTASELNNNYFQIERSANGFDFKAIGSVTGAGNSAEILHYSFSDDAPLAGTNYYRLMQVDYDGNFSYSDIRVVQVAEVSSAISIFPNPASDYISVTLFGFANDILLISILDFSGNILLQEVLKPIEQNNTIQIPVSHLPSGTYMLQANSGKGNIETIPFIRL